MADQKGPAPYPEPPPPYHPGDAPPPGFTAAPGQGYAAGYPGVPGGPQVVVGAPPTGQVTSVTVVNVAQWGPYPMQVSCPGCGAQILTSTSTSPGLLTWLLSGALVLLGCWFGCCLIPCCVPECQDVDHHCPSCKRHMGTFRRL